MAAWQYTSQGLCRDFGRADLDIFYKNMESADSRKENRLAAGEWRLALLSGQYRRTGQE
ncbi:MAG: hypothetical protein ACLTMD_04965 [Clostridium sp.]